MNLGFSTKWPDGTLTNFPVLILHGLMLHATERKELSILDFFMRQLLALQDYQAIVGPSTGHPKLHTIRKGNRWKAGNQIDFWINQRSEDMTRIAPRVPVTSVQGLEIRYSEPIYTGPNTYVEIKISIDGEHYGTIVNNGGKVTVMTNRVNALILNDGFPNAKDFLNWFSEDFTGQIIHWTLLNY